MCSNLPKNYIHTYDRVGTSFVSTTGERFAFTSVDNLVALELIRIGAISPRSLCRNFSLPFSSQTIKVLLSIVPIDDLIKDRSWFDIEQILDEISGYAVQYPEIQKIRDKLCDALFSTCCDSNCFLLQKKFVEYSCHIYCNKVIDYIKYNIVRMVLNKTVDVTFYRMDPEDLQMILDEDFLNTEEEQQVIPVIDAWIQIKPKEREKFRSLLMSSVRGISLPSSIYEELSKYYQLSVKPARKYCDTLITIGGWVSRHASSDIDWFDCEHSMWRRSKIRMPVPLAYHGAAIADGTLYIFGGSDGFRVRNNTWKLDISTGEWIACDVMHNCRNFITNSCVTFDDKIYVFGGQYDRQFETVSTIRSRTGEFYDPKLDKWTLTANMGFMRSDCAAAAYKNQIIITGGFSGTHLLNTAEIYYPQGDYFVQIMNLPSILSGHAMVVHDSNLYIVGGFDTRNRIDKIVVWERDSYWTVLENSKLLKGRSTFSATSYRGSIVTAGGYTNSADSRCETILATRSDFQYVPNLIQRKSCTKVLNAPNFRQILEGFGTVPIDDLTIDDNTESQYEYDNSTINEQV